jgi:myo-inositol-1(or 4)-monophosphatase
MAAPGEGEAGWTCTDDQIEEFLATAVRLVKEAGLMISGAMERQQNKEIEVKAANVAEGNSSAVLTETDMKVEQHIISGLRQLYPDHQFIGEEGVAEGQVTSFTAAPTWIIDPIDGTMNFVHSNPVVCTSVGLTVNRKLAAGVVHCPVLGLTYTAVKGRGARCNGRLLSVSGCAELAKAMVVMELPVGANPGKKETALRNLSTVMDRSLYSREFLPGLPEWLPEAIPQT